MTNSKRLILSQLLTNLSIGLRMERLYAIDTNKCSISVNTDLRQKGFSQWLRWEQEDTAFGINLQIPSMTVREIGRINNWCSAAMLIVWSIFIYFVWEAKSVIWWPVTVSVNISIVPLGLMRAPHYSNYSFFFFFSFLHFQFWLFMICIYM